jgi:tetrahydromethanopterin S-methyltransferase subunit G
VVVPLVEKDKLKYVVENMDDRFDRLEIKLDNIRVENKTRIADIDKRIDGNRRNIEKLDKKVFQLFYVGTGVGFLLGVATTVVAKSLMGG